MLNIHSIVGRVSRAPELKEVGSSNVCKFSVAVDQRGKKSGEDGKTDFFDVEVWGDKAATFAQEWVKVGKVVALSGRHESRRYEKDGIKFTAWTFKADTVNPFIEKRDAGSSFDSDIPL